MIKICALDFLKKETFGTDVMYASGEILYSAKDEVTPEILLKLYFKEIYSKEKIQVKVEEEDSQIKLQGDELDEMLVFDEAQALRVSKYSLEMAKILGWDEKECKDLQQAAYYHNVGDIEFTKKDKLLKGYRQRRAEAGYNHLFKTLGLPDRVAEVSKLYVTNYDTESFELDKKNRSNIPFYQIVAIASYYDEFLMNTSSKKEAIMKMLRLGGNKFNLFLLHKFLYKMRNTND